MNSAKPYYPLKALLFCSIALLFACTDSSSSSESGYAISYLDRGLPYPVELSVNGTTERLIPGQEVRTTLKDGVNLELSIESHSPLVQCGFRPRGVQSLEMSLESGREAVLDCEFVDFLQNSQVDSVSHSVEERTLVSEGSSESTRTFWSGGLAIPWGRVGMDLLVSIDRSEYKWIDAEDFSLRSTAWPKEDLASVGIGDDRMYLLYADQEGGGEVRVAESVESAPIPLVTLPALDGDLNYFNLSVRAGQVVIAASGAIEEVDTRQFFVVDPNRPQGIRGPLSTQGKLTEFYGDLRSGIYELELDNETQDAWLHGLVVGENVLGKWRVPEDGIQRAQLWTQAFHDPIVGVRYLDGSDNGCASFYRFKGLEWHLMRDFCEDHTDIEVLHWRLWGETLHMTASAESGSLIPEEPSLVVVPNLDEPQNGVHIIRANQFEGRIIDSLPTYGGGFFYATSPLPEGCSLGPWLCVDEGRLYHFSTEPNLAVSKVFEGQFGRGILLGIGAPIVSEAWPVAERVIFTSITPEFGNELWRSDGTADGTYLLRDQNPGPELKTMYWWSNQFISTSPVDVYR